MTDINKIFKIKEPVNYKLSPPVRQSIDAVEDYSVKKVMNTQEGTIEKTPINDNDIVNKKFINDGFTTDSIILNGYIVNEIKCWDITVTTPGAFYAIDTQIPVAYTKYSTTISKIVVTTNSSSYEVSGDIKWADDLISFTNATVINDFDTSSGVRTDTSITSGTVSADKYIYLQFDSAPSSAVTWVNIHIEYSYN